jgi:hypothetical protein
MACGCQKSQVPAEMQANNERRRRLVDDRRAEIASQRERRVARDRAIREARAARRSA